MRDSEKRRRVMQRSMRLGHCICNPRQPCPCDELKEHDICHCAGERRAGPAGPVRLTSLVENPGCASKIDQASLKAVLAGLPAIDNPDVIIGMPAGDDAGVFRFGEGRALVQTVDVFSPSVDDPYTFGQIAAANSLSDVYAMGGRPLTALSIVGYPVREAPPEAMAEILRGGVEKMAEAGVPVIGGHSINDREIKAGFAVTGVIAADEIITNAGAVPGDALVLTKPIGTGVVAFAGQIGMAEEAWVGAAAASMASLNATASRLMREFGAHAATDVTGFGLVGHLGEMAERSGVDVAVVWDDIPLLEGVLECAARGAFPGAIERNRESSEDRAVAGDGVTREMLDICFDAQTSGGLLVALPAGKAAGFVERLRASGVVGAAVIGAVASAGSGRIFIETNGARQFPILEATTEMKKRETAAASGGEGVRPGEPACCEEEEAEPSAVRTAAAEDEACCAGADSGAGRAGAVGSGPAAAGAAGTEAAFKGFMRRAGTPGALDVTTKQALNIALSLVTKCGPCTKIHIRKAREMGFTEVEIDEAAWMAVAFGGCSVMMFYNQYRNQS